MGGRSWARAPQGATWLERARPSVAKINKLISRPSRERLALSAGKQAAARSAMVSHPGWGCSRSSSHWGTRQLHIEAPPEPAFIPTRAGPWLASKPHVGAHWKGPSLAFNRPRRPLIQHSLIQSLQSNL